MQPHEWFALAVASVISGLYLVAAARARRRALEALQRWYEDVLVNGR